MASNTNSSIINPFAKAVVLLLVCIGLSGCVPAVVGVGGAAVAAGSTEKGFGTSVSDTSIKLKINERLFEQDHGLFQDITVTVNEGSVLMTGKVEAPEDKVEATQLAWQVKGVVEVINEAKVTDTSSIKDSAKDLAAAAQMRAKLIGDGDVSSLNFSVDVVNGTVYLSGIASSEAEMQKVVEHARSLRFAQEVVNYIRVTDDDRE